MFNFIFMLLTIFNSIVTEPTYTQAYSMTAVVVYAENDIVTIENYLGDQFEFVVDDEFEWVVGDITSCLMDDCGTADITDDIIVSVRYGGHTSEWNGLNF